MEYITDEEALTTVMKAAGKYKDCKIGEAVSPYCDFLTQSRHKPSDNMHVDGAKVDNPIVDDDYMGIRTRVRNYTQILRNVICINTHTSFDVSEEIQSLEIQYKLTTALSNLGRDLEYAIDNGPMLGEEGSAIEPRRMRGIYGLSDNPDYDAVTLLFLRKPHVVEINDPDDAKRFKRFMVSMEVSYSYEWDEEVKGADPKRNKKVDIPTEAWQKDVERKLDKVVVVGDIDLVDLERRVAALERNAEWDNYQERRDAVEKAIGIDSPNKDNARNY